VLRRGSRLWATEVKPPVAPETKLFDAVATPLVCFSRSLATRDLALGIDTVPLGPRLGTACDADAVSRSNLVRVFGPGLERFASVAPRRSYASAHASIEAARPVLGRKPVTVATRLSRTIKRFAPLGTSPLARRAAVACSQGSLAASRVFVDARRLRWPWAGLGVVAGFARCIGYCW